jgi:two-component system sensor histidine kinase YesM
MLRNISFRYKLFLIIFITAVAPISFVAAVLYQRAVFEITSQISSVVVNTLNFTSDYIEPSLQNVINTSDLILSEETILSAAAMERPMSYAEIVAFNKAAREILTLYVQRIKSLYSTFGFDSFYMYLPRHNLLLDSKTTFYENIRPENLDFLVLDQEKKSWHITREVDFYTLNQIDNRFGFSRLLSYGNQVRDKNGEPILYLASNVRVDFLSSYYNRIEKGIPGNFLILDGEGGYIANSHEELGRDFAVRVSALIAEGSAASGSFDAVLSGQRWFVVYSVSPRTDWKYTVAVPSNTVFGQIYNIQKFFILTALVITALILPVCFIVSGGVYRPMEKLVLAMQEIEAGRLDVRINDRRGDEYQKVYLGFNKMAEELNKLVEDLANEQVLKKQAEINALQAQINPHFLYNTLDSIYSIAVMHKVDEISKITAALSKFFRTSLSGGKQDITLKEELDIIKNYLVIQNIRFNNKIEFTISVPPEYLDLAIPKLLLQPIVENSIYHGMERKKGKGHLSVRCLREGNLLRILVSDDGIGMSPGQLRSLRASIEGEGGEGALGKVARGNFALRTLSRQLILKYGEGCGLEIESSPGEGTTVSVSIPAPVSA